LRFRVFSLGAASVDDMIPNILPVAVPHLRSVPGRFETRLAAASTECAPLVKLLPLPTLVLVGGLPSSAGSMSRDGVLDRRTPSPIESDDTWRSAEAPTGSAASCESVLPCKISQMMFVFGPQSSSACSVASKVLASARSRTPLRSFAEAALACSDSDHDALMMMDDA